MKVDQVLDVQLAKSGGDPIELPGVSVTLGFYINGQYCYGFRFGPTDSSGHLRVTFGEAEAQRLQALQIQPWDYKNRIDECDPKLTVTVPSQDELNASIEVATSFNFRTTPEHVKWWANANNHRINCEPVDVNLRGRETDVIIRCSLVDEI